jgi:ATP-dependent helicase/nuclease subunit A
MLEDQQNRNEIIAYDGHIFIVAGAGTGKSTIIADKLLRLLEDKKIQSIKNIAAITYTNKAAAELKWKIEEKLYHRINETKSKETAAILQNSLNVINECSIGTIHSFCVRLLRKYGYREMMDPMFSIASKEESDVMLHDAFSQYISKITRETTDIGKTWKELLQPGNYDSLGALFNDVQLVIEKAHLLENIDLEDFPVKSSDDLKNYQLEIFKEHVARFMKYLQHYDYAGEASANVNSLGGRLAALNDILLHDDNPLMRIKYDNSGIQPERYRGGKNYILESSPFENINHILKEYLLLFANYPFHEDHSVKDELRQHFTSDILPEHSGITNHTLNNEHTRFLFYRGIKDFHEFFMNFKREKSVLSYNDIIYYTNKIINDKSVLKHIQRQYNYIFVDEYQDTDPMQTSIFTKLADSIYAASRTSQTGDPEYSSLKLVRVGDAKQSIYSFRGADLETFHREKDKFHDYKSGHTGHLHVNMRSHPQIINFINKVFSPTAKNTPMEIASYEPISAGTNNSRLPEPGVYINYFKSLNEAKAANIKATRISEAAWLAGEIESLLSLNKNLSICILFLTMKNNLEPYVAQLNEKKIPYHLVGRRYYGENFTKRYLTLFCKFLYNHNDLVSLTGFLRSPVGGFTDLEVESVVSSKYIINVLQQEAINKVNFNTELNMKVEKIAELFKTCALLAHNQSLPAMIFYLLDNSCFFTFTDLLYNREIIRESIDRFLEIAVSVENMSFKTFHEKFRHFIDEIEKLENIPEVDENVESGGVQNAVQIMSYHKSKGLEFDVVFMADLAYSKNNRTEKLLLESTYDAPAGSRQTAVKKSNVLFHYKDDLSHCTTNNNDPESILNRKKTEELVRLAYVAMTRTKERLYLPIHNPLKKTTSLLNFFYETLTEKFSIFSINDEVDEKKETWSQVKYDADSEDSFCYIKSYDVPVEPGETADDESYETAAAAPLEKVPWHKSQPPVSYSFVSGTSIMKKQAAEKGIAFDKTYVKPAERNVEDVLASDSSENEPDEENDRRESGDLGVDAMTRGVIAHSIFEMADLKNPIVHERLFEALFYTHAFNRQMQANIEKYAKDLIEIYKQSRLFTLVSSSQIIGKEIPFSRLFGRDWAHEADDVSHISENTVNQKQIAVGYIDLVIKDSENVVHIIDYKTNAKPDSVSFDEFSQHLLQIYKIPMKLYKNTLENVFPGLQIKSTLYHTPSGECFSYEK